MDILLGQCKFEIPTPESLAQCAVRVITYSFITLGASSLSFPSIKGKFKIIEPERFAGNHLALFCPLTIFTYNT